MERSILGDGRADEDHDQSDNVDGELELEEALDVVEDVATPHASLDNGVEVIIGQQNVGSFLSNISSSDTHSETDIGLLKGWSIVGSVTSDSDSCVQVAETCDEQVLVLWASASQDPKGWHEVSEDFRVDNDLLSVLLSALAVERDQFVASPADETSSHLGEIWTFHADLGVADVLFLDNIALDTNGHGGGDVVTSDHSDHDASSGDLFDGIWHFCADNIHNTKD